MLAVVCLLVRFCLHQLGGYPQDQTNPLVRQIRTPNLGSRMVFLVASSNFFLRQRVSTLAAHRGSHAAATCVLWRLPVRVPGTLGNTGGRAIPGCVQDCAARAAVATLRLLVEEHPHCPSGTAQSLAATHET
jgi:hypothetical protein